MAIILASFAFYNATTSFLQFNLRHVLMGSSAHYFLSGVTLGFIFENYVLRIPAFFRRIIRSHPLSTIIFPERVESSKTNPLKRIDNLQKSKAFLKVQRLHGTFAEGIIIGIKFSQKFFSRILTILVLFSLILAVIIFFSFIKKGLLSIEQSNIKDMQVFVDSLEKKPLEFDTNQKTLKLDPSLVSQTIGIYCEMGQVLSSKEVYVTALIPNYNTKITPISGKNIILFIPFHISTPKSSLKIEDNGQCKSFYWSDLKSWKGALWEGSYDRSTLIKK